MREVIVNLEQRSYPIYIGSDILSQTKYYKELIKTKQVMVVTDSNVSKLQMGIVIKALSEFDVTSYVLPPGEEQKNLENFNLIITELLSQRFARTSCLIALGGGVIGDMTGFSAAC